MIAEFGLHERMALRSNGFEQKRVGVIKAPVTLALPAHNEQHYVVRLIETQEEFDELTRDMSGTETVWTKKE